MLYQVVNWSDNFEGAKSKGYKNKSSCQMPTKHGLGYRRLIKKPDGPGLFGAWCSMIQVLSRHPAPRQGYLTDTGRIPSDPLTTEDLELLTDIPAALFGAMLKACSDNKIGWIRYHTDTTRIPQESKVSPQYPLDSDLDLDSDSDLSPQKPKEIVYPVFAKLVADEWPLTGNPPLAMILGKLKGAGIPDQDATDALRFYIDNPEQQQYYNLAKTSFIHEAISGLYQKSKVAPFPKANGKHTEKPFDYSKLNQEGY